VLHYFLFKVMKPEDAKMKIGPGELRFNTSRSSGPGGQNVNKVNTKVELRFNVKNSPSLSEEEKIIISEKLKNRISSEGDLIIVSQSERTQTGNKGKVLEIFFRLIASALTRKPTRRATKPTNTSKAERLKSKKIRSGIKKQRQIPDKES
jgi:ribosome-associated protein